MIESSTNRRRRYQEIDNGRSVELLYKEHTNWISLYRCIDNLPEFLQSVADVVNECTGWTGGCWAAGPEPAQGGRPMVVRFVSNSHLRLSCTDDVA